MADSVQERVAAKEVAFGIFKAGWNACVARAGGLLKTYPGELFWDVIAREEFEAFYMETQKLWEEQNEAAGIKAFNQVYIYRDAQPIPTPQEATNPGLWR